jgi:hypothetical protein
VDHEPEMAAWIQPTRLAWKQEFGANTGFGFSVTRDSKADGYYYVGVI